MNVCVTRCIQKQFGGGGRAINTSILNFKIVSRGKTVYVH